MAKWNRIIPTKKETDLLDQLVRHTPGMTRYGNRARVAVMVPTHLAVLIAELMQASGQSAGTVCAELLNDALKSKKKKKKVKE